MTLISVPAEAAKRAQGYPRPAFLFAFFWILPALALASTSACDTLRTRELRKMAIKVGGNSVLAEIAATPEDRQRGLMYRTNIAEDEGMLFVFAAPSVQTFWMKNTLVPLDIGFFDNDAYLIQFLGMEPDDGKAMYSSGEPALYALEMNRGWFKKKLLRKYAKMELPQEIRGL